jgi:phenylpropionate dioxygenase-like ring-hydroxylating dioxygenase large terminal subunit
MYKSAAIQAEIDALPPASGEPMSDLPPAMYGPGPSVQDLLDQERGPVPEALRRSSSVDLGTEPIPASRYTSAEFLAHEFQSMWSRTWQMACREEDLPQPGDYYVYEIGSASVLVVRQVDGDIRAFENVCLHRGRLLKEKSGHAQFLRCPFHAFTWNLDGGCRQVTNEWDFPHVDKDQFNLPQIHVGRWGGFVFVNLAAEPESLESYLEDLPQIYRTRGWDLALRVKAVHVSKRNACNWKVALEAFIESYHVVATHPSAMTYLGDAFTQYDVWPDRRNYTRMISPRGLASPHVGRVMSEQEIYEAGSRGAVLTDDERVLPEGLTARQALGDRKRRFLRDEYGVDIPDMTDCEALDTIQYHIFPNLVCWAGWGSFLVYRFRPDGNDPARSIMDIFFLVPNGADGDVRVAREPHWLGVEDSHHLAPELGPFAAVFDEDQSNLPFVQRGLAAMRGPGITLSRYEEMRIRYFHKRLDDYLSGRC